MAALVGLGLAGVLEREDSAGATGADGAARAEWPTVTRQGLMPSLTVTVDNGGPVARVPVVRIAAGYLHDLQFDGVSPEPESQETVGDGLVELRFPALEPGARLEAELHFDIGQQAEALRARSPLVVLLGGRTLLSEQIRTVILP